MEQNIDQASCRQGVDLPTVRRLLRTHFDDETALTQFCFDFFPAVYREFEAEHNKSAKLRRLLDYCDEQDQLASLRNLLVSDEAAPKIEPARPEPIPTQPATQATTVADRPSTSKLAGATPAQHRRPIPFKLQVARLAGSDFELRAFATPMGEPAASSRLPYDPGDLIAVLKALEWGYYDASYFSDSQTETLSQLGLLDNGRFASDLLARVGRGLYAALFPEDVGDAFRMALNQARPERRAVALQVRFDPDVVPLARYPWELLHDGHRHLLSAGAVELTRYISYPEATTPLPASPPWRLLYIESRPGDLEALPAQTERLVVWEALQKLAESDKLSLDRLASPTYDGLLDQLAQTDYHLIHFDGHGLFARRCSNCERLHYPHLQRCQTCDLPLDPPQGYLAFEDPDGRSDYVSAAALENLIYNSPIRLVLLSACQSAMVRGETLFGGLGPGLIRAGVPAVVAVQFSIPVSAAVGFASGFYAALAQGETVPGAVAQGRRRLFRSKTWFIPTLYLRSSDDTGRLFVE